MSIATLLSQHNQVTAVDIIPEKVDLINNRKSPIQDDYIEKYLAEKDLNLTATLDAKAAFKAFRCVMSITIASIFAMRRNCCLTKNFYICFPVEQQKVLSFIHWLWHLSSMDLI